MCLTKTASYNVTTITQSRAAVYMNHVLSPSFRALSIAQLIKKLETI